jgi:hypothetical protein
MYSRAFPVQEDTRSQPVCKGDSYPDNAFPELREKEVKVRLPVYGHMVATL